MTGTVSIRGKQRTIEINSECSIESQVLTDLCALTSKGVKPTIKYNGTSIQIQYEATVLEVTSPSHPPQLFADLVESSHKQQYRVEPRE